MLDHETLPRGLRNLQLGFCESLSYQSWQGKFKHVQSQPGQGNSAERPSDLEMAVEFLSDPGQRIFAGVLSELDIWSLVQSTLGQRAIAKRNSGRSHTTLPSGIRMLAFGFDF